jgi:hypothetical protein
MVGILAVEASNGYGGRRDVLNEQWRREYGSVSQIWRERDVLLEGMLLNTAVFIAQFGRTLYSITYMASLCNAPWRQRWQNLPPSPIPTLVLQHLVHVRI